jgi:protocatechuate 3,4-dioxygenase beta subunit
VTQRLNLLFATLMLLLAACAPSSAPAQPAEAPGAAQGSSNTPAPTAVLPTHTPAREPTNSSSPASSPLPELTQMPTAAATSTPPPVVSESEGPTNAATPAPSPEMAVCDGTLTPAQTEGPFYTPDTPERGNLVEAGMGGTLLLVTGKVLNQNCEPIRGAKLDFWQADDNGEYDNVDYRLRGHQFADENGNYMLETILPGRYPGRTPHIHVKIFAPDGREVLTTQIYFSGVSDQIPDGIFRPDLLARDLGPDASGRRHVAFDFVVRD